MSQKFMTCGSIDWSADLLFFEYVTVKNLKHVLYAH